MDPDNLPTFVELHKNHKHTLKLGFYAAPSNPKIFSKAVKDELNKLKFTYCSDLNGLIMGFGKINSNEVIQADIKYCISVVINVDVYIFRPPVGSIIEAIVNQTSDNHVSCLVHNLFNVSIVRPENQPYHQWSGSKVYKDDKINVKVLSFDLTKKLPHITGNIVDNEKDECYSYKNDQNNYFRNHSSIDESFKSFDLKNDILNCIKHIETDDSASSSNHSINGSKSSDEEENITISHSKYVNDKCTKVFPLFDNSKHIKGNHIKKEDTASSSKFSMNDSESSDEEEHTAISHSKVVNDKCTKVSPLFDNSKHIKGNHIKKEDTASSSKFSMNDSESSDEEEHTAISHSKVVNDKCTKVSPLFDNSKHIKRPLFSSTPVSGSENSVNNINLIRNKQLVQLHKHLAKNRSEKQILVDSIKTRDKFSEKSLSQSSNISVNVKNNNNDGNEYNLLHTSIKSNDNSNDVSRINQEDSLPNDSGINDDEHKQFPIHNSFLNTNKKSTKTIINNKSSDKIVNAILHSFSPNKQQSKTNRTKNNLSVGFNMSHSSNDDEGNVYTQPLFNSDEKNSVYTQRLPVQDLINSIEENSVYTQHAPDYNNSDEKNSVYTQHVKQLINSSSSDEEILNNDYKPKIKTSSALNFSTKSISESITNQEKDKNKTDYKHSYITTLGMISSDSESNNEDIELPIKVKNLEMSFEREIKNNTTNNLLESKINIINTQYSSSSDVTSSDDDDIYAKLKQNISKLDVTDSMNYTTNNDNNSLMNKNKLKEKKEKCTLQTSKCSNDKNKLSQNIIITKDGVTKHILEEESSNDDEVKTDDYNINKNKNKLEKQNQTKQVKNESILLKSQNVISKKDEMIKYILNEETSTDEEVNANILNIDNYNLSLNKNKLKKQNKNKQEKDKSTLLQLSKCNNVKSELSQNVISGKDEIIKHILKTEISSDDDEVKTDISNINNCNLSLNKSKLNKQEKDKSTLLQLSKCNSDKTKSSLNVISRKNAIIKCILGEGISSDDEVKADISNINKNLSISSNKKTQNKINRGKDKSMLLQSPMHSNSKSNLSQNEISKEIYKNGLIKHIVKEDSNTDDDVKCASSSVLQSNQNTFKNSSNPFIKSYAADVHTSSSEDDTVNINLIKSKDINALSKKNSTPLIKKGNKKNDLIKEVLKSIKRQNKKYKHTSSVKHFDSNYLEDNKKLSKIEKNKPRVEDKKSSLKELKTVVNFGSVEEPKLNTSVQNNNNVLKIKIQPSTDDSTDDEVDVIKQIIEKKRKLSKIWKTEPLELTMKYDISTKLNENNSFEKLDKKIKPQEMSISTDELINNIVKKKTNKRPDDTKDLLLDGIINTIEDSSSSFVPTKKKKKDHNLIETYDVSDGNLSKVKKKKKKTKLSEDINLNDLTMQNNKKKSNDSSILFVQQDTLSREINTNSIDVSKKKVKKIKSDTNKLSEINDTLTDTNVKKKKPSISTDNELINSILRTKQKKRLNDTKDLLLDGIINTIEDYSSSFVPTKKKKKDHNLIETYDVSDGNLSKVKKKKKKTKLSEDINLNDLTMQNNKKKSNDSSILFVQQDMLSREINTNSIDVSKKKVKKIKSDTNKLSEINDTLTNTNVKKKKPSISTDNELINNILRTKQKKRLNDTKDLLLDGIINTIEDYSSSFVPTKKKKKDHNLIETYDVSDGNLSKVKKKKKKTKLSEDINLNDLTMQNNKKKSNDSSILFVQQDMLSREINTNSIDVSKKKVKKIKSDTNKLSEINDTLTDTNVKKKKPSISTDNELINNILRTKQKKRLNDTKDLLLDGIINTIEDYSSSFVPTKKKKKDHSLIETNDMSDINLPKVKKKKKKSKLSDDINLNDLINKKKINDSSIIIEHQNMLSKDKNTSYIDVSKKKLKSLKGTLIN